MNNEIKTTLQRKEFEALKDKHRVLLEWATGVGKSKMTIDLINRHIGYLFRGKLKYKILFVVAERAHIKNWEDEFTKWQLKRANADIDICCYASLHKYNSEYYDVIVLDEAHHMFTEKRMALLQDMPKSSYQHIYLLSATLSSGKIDMAEEIFGKFTISNVSLKDAIQSDILPDPKVYVVAMELDNNTVNQEIKVNKADNNSPVVSWENRMKYLVKNIPCIIKCTERQKYLYYTEIMEYWKQRYERSKNQFQHNLWVNTGSVRKRFLGELKTSAVFQLIASLPRNKRFVCFCSSVAQADTFSISDTISSKKSSKRNQYIIDLFNARRINSIYAVGMITEGMNLKDIHLGIIVQLDGKERLFIQKFGRSLRAEDPVSFIFYYKDTQDENYLKKALENIDDKYIQYININQLKTIKL